MYLCGVFLPVGGVVVMLFTPQPGLHLERRGGMGPLVVLVALVALTAAAVGGLAAAVFYLAGFALLTVTLPVLLRRGWSIEITVGATTLLLMMTIALVLFGLVTTPVGLAHGFHDVLQQGRETLLEMYREAGMAPQRIEEIGLVTGTAVSGLVRLLPALVVVSLGVTVLLNLMLVRRHQRRAKSVPVFGDLTRWRFPAWLAWCLVASGYGAGILTGVPQTVATNALVVVLAVYFLQGITIVQYYFDRWQSPWWMRVVVYAVLVLEWLFAAGVVGLGVFDLWADFRRLTPRLIEDDDD